MTRACAREQPAKRAGVGYDIGRGNKAVRTSLLADEIDIPRVMDEIVALMSMHRMVRWTHLLFCSLRTAIWGSPTSRR